MQEKIKQFLEKGILVSPELMDDIEGLSFDSIEAGEHDIVIEKKHILKKQELPETKEKEDKNQPVQVLHNYLEKNTKKSIRDFTNLYTDRYKLLQGILRQRQELQGASAIRKIRTANNNDTVSLIGLVLEINTTKNNNLIFTLEDQTGYIKAVVTKAKKELFDIAKDITPDEVIGVEGAKGDNIIFINNIILPDVPLTKELKKSPEEEAAVFIGDIHIGSDAFLKEPFERFIMWLKGKTGTEAQREVVKKIRYLFVMGDLVEGIGIFPGQDKELLIKDIYEQYKVFSDYIKQIPGHIQVIICPGNHDSLRVAEPQPPIPKEMVPELYELDNVHFVSSPSEIRIGQNEHFSGFDVLLYHGYSFPYYASNIESVRMAGGLENTQNIMEYLLKKRHIAPTHGSTQYQLGYLGDPLVIKNVPDFFVTGHIHRASIKNYRNITLLNCSCWVSQTAYQEKRGLVPQPARAIYVDLKTRESKIMSFMEA